GDELDAALAPLLREDDGSDEVAALLDGEAGEIITLWCIANAWRTDVSFARLLESAPPTRRDRIARIARRRVLEGPMADALQCAPRLGRGAELALPENAEAMARFEILVWEA